MPISPIVLQRRHAELGRIRLGHKASTQRGGTRPAKLEMFRFTSPSERYIRDLAELYGGTAQPWDNSGMRQWEVFTEAKTVPVIAVKGGLSQWMETWSGGGCVHRCDGEQQVDGTPCDQRDPNHVNAKPTTRLSVMLPELEAIGVWRLETHGWNAAAEIPAVAELAQFAGELVPAHLHLMERRAIQDGKTSRFAVPVLDLQIGTRRLREIVAAKSGGPALAASDGERVAIAAPRPDYSVLIDDAETVGTCQELWKQAGEAGHLDDALKEAITARADELKRHTVGDAPDYPDSTPADDETVEAEVVEDEQPTTDPGADPRAAVWQQLLAAAGTHGLGFDETRSMVEKQASLPLAECTVEHLQAALHTLTTGEVPEAVSA